MKLILGLLLLVVAVARDARAARPVRVSNDRDQTADLLAIDALELGHYGRADEPTGRPAFEVQTGVTSSNNDGGLLIPLPDSITIPPDTVPPRRRADHPRRHGPGDGPGRHGRHHNRGPHGGLPFPPLPNERRGHHGFGFIQDGPLPLTDFMRPPPMFNMTLNERLTELCNRLQSVGSSGRGPMDWKLRRLDNETRQQMETIWRRRRDGLLPCCDMAVGDERAECFNNSMLARYNRVCNGEEPVCPWSLALRDTTRNAGQQSNTTYECCRNEGWARMRCFQEAHERFRHQRHAAHHGGHRSFGRHYGGGAGGGGAGGRFYHRRGSRGRPNNVVTASTPRQTTA